MNCHLKIVLVLSACLLFRAAQAETRFVFQHTLRGINPRFTDALAGDYSVLPGSPVPSLGVGARQATNLPHR